MTIQEPKKIDIVGLDKGGEEVILTIVDHLEWDDTDAHSRLLQEKLNSYLAFIESGELLESYPQASGRKVVIEVLMSYPPNESGIEFYNQASLLISSAGFELRNSLLEKPVSESVKD